MVHQMKEERKRERLREASLTRKTWLVNDGRESWRERKVVREEENSLINDGLLGICFIVLKLTAGSDQINYLV